MPLNYSEYPISLPTIPSTGKRPRVDLNVPNYDRENDRGNYLVMSLNDGVVEFSSYCPSFSRALAMTRLSKRQPTWILQGAENELVLLKRMCSMKASWITQPMMDNFVRTQLGKTIKIVTTVNM